jgi:Cu2+-exporting ATPase
MTEKTVLHVGGLHWATSAVGVERVLCRQPGVVGVSANAVAQTATVEFDADTTSVDQLQAWTRECGFHCAGESAPTHICEPDVAPHGRPLARRSATDRAGTADTGSHMGGAP